MRKFIVDIYGGDNGPEVVIKGALKVLAQREDLFLTFAGEKALVENIAKEMKADLSRIDYIDTKAFITNHDNPKMIFNGFNDSSLVMAYEAAKNHDEVDGVISCGATGAVMIGSIFRLGLLEGVTAPVLSACLLSFTHKPLLLVDCGANVDIKADALVKFAKYGTAYVKSSFGIESPRVGLLNVGTEPGKGNLLCKEAYKLLENCGVNFAGNIEGFDVFEDKCDVLVCDGFNGNVILKLAESVGLACASKAKDKDFKNELTDLFSYNEQGCSVLLGTKKIVAKAHGKANEVTIENSIKQAVALADGHFIDKLKESL